MEPINDNDRRIMAEGKISDEAREFMLEVAACSEHLGEDGMCDCARFHFDALATLEAENAELKKRCMSESEYAEYVQGRHDMQHHIDELTALIAAGKGAP